MIGEKMVITDLHRRAAGLIAEALRGRLGCGTYAVTVAGESGSGKTGAALCLAELLRGEGLRCVVLSQDDYFRLPPKSNHAKRVEDIEWVGPGEVRLDLMDEHLGALKGGQEVGLVKPLVHYEEDRIGEETLAPGPYDVVVVEGTYTTLLANADFHAFIDSTYEQTREGRALRGREPPDPFIEKVLAIEHGIISANKGRADLVIPAWSEEGAE